eukprot:749806-Hanusia_phi.AAC.2
MIRPAFRVPDSTPTRQSDSSPRPVPSVSHPGRPGAARHCGFIFYIDVEVQTMQAHGGHRQRGRFNFI